MKTFMEMAAGLILLAVIGVVFGILGYSIGVGSLASKLPHYQDGRNRKTFIPNRDDAWVVRLVESGPGVRVMVTRAVPQWDEKAGQWKPESYAGPFEVGWTRKWYRTEAEARESVGLDMLEQRKDGE